MDTFVCIGQLGKAHGVRGTVSVHPMTDFPERFRSTETVFVAHDGAEPAPYAVLKARLAAGRVLLDLEGVTDREAARALTNAFVYVPADETVALGEGEYYFFQLTGCTVVNHATDQRLGTVVDGERLPSNDVLKVRLERGGTVFVPMTAQVIASVDIDAKLIRINVLKGLL